MDLKEVTDAAFQLSIEERLELLGLIEDSLTDNKIPISADVRAEIETRLRTYEEDKAAARPWDEVYADLTKKSER